MLCVGVFLLTDSRVRVGDRSVVCLVCYSPQNWDRDCVEDCRLLISEFFSGIWMDCYILRMEALGGAHWKHIFPSITLRSATLH